MNKKITEELTKEVELFLQRTKDLEYNMEDLARVLVSHIRQNGFYIGKWEYPKKYLLVPEDQRISYCFGCFNEFESCGTPCVTCNKADEFYKEWEYHQGLANEYCVYKRKEVK